MAEKRKMLKEVAVREIKRLIAALPKELQVKIKPVAIVFEYKPRKTQIADGIENDTLGVFAGQSLMDGDDGLLPRQIILFLANIRDESRSSGRTYPEELRRTFLHELGHYLGLEEPDLVIRDVD